MEPPIVIVRDRRLDPAELTLTLLGEGEALSWPSTLPSTPVAGRPSLAINSF